MTNNRIEYIDLAKGMCIILVVVFHIFAYYQVRMPLGYFFRAFRMPLYFFLSGVFFKTYGGFWHFIKKKTNKLLIPFVFFYLTLSVFISIFLYRCFGIVIEKAVNFEVIPALTEFISRENFPNSPIWFLLCLFEVNILFYLCYSIADICKKYKQMLLIGLTMTVGIMGLFLSLMQINLPMFIDSSMTALPFFMMGYVINKYTAILKQNKLDKYCALIILVCFAFVLLFAGHHVSYKQNHFSGMAYYTIYLCGLMGTLGIMYCAKKLNRLPLVSYWGRYSIMILVTHRIVYQAVSPLAIVMTGGVNYGTVMVNLAITLLSYLLIIPFMRKYLPYVTAQKDIIR